MRPMPLAHSRNFSLNAARLAAVHTGSASTQSKYRCSAVSSVWLHAFIDVSHAFASNTGLVGKVFGAKQAP